MFDLMEWLQKQEPGFRLQRTPNGWQAIGGRGFVFGQAVELPDCLMQAVAKQGGSWAEPETLSDVPEEYRAHV